MTYRRSRSPSLVRVVITAISIAAVAACTSNVTDTDATQREPGPRLADTSSTVPALRPEADVPVSVERREPATIHGPIVVLPPSEVVLFGQIGGTLELERDCVMLQGVNQRSIVFWPSGTKWDDVTQTVRTGDLVIAMGQTIVAGGGYARAMPSDTDLGPGLEDFILRCFGSTPISVAGVFGDIEVVP